MTGVSAVGFSPSSLTFNLAKGEEQCQSIHLDSDSQTIEIIDVWAESAESEWKVSQFTTSSSSHNLQLSYPSELSISQRDVEVCLSGTNEGEHHGAIIFKQEQEGNSVIQLAVWLKVIIDTPQTQSSSSGSSGGSSGGSSSGGSGGGGGSAIKSSNSQVTEQNNQEEPIGPQSDISGNAKITGAVINEGNGSINYYGIFIISLIIIIGLSAVYYRRYKQRQKWLGYE